MDPERSTLHGTYSREHPPVLTVDSGDTVRFRTLDSGWNLEPHKAPGQRSRAFEPRDPERDWGHALCGPVAIRGAEPGMTLAVRIDDIRSGTWGHSCGGGGPWHLNPRLGTDAPPEVLYLWQLDPDRNVGTNQMGQSVRLRPFMGQLGMPPDEPGLHSTFPPRNCGGNIDCKELVAGSTLYLPIAVPGALFSTGDGHAVQGDGEVSGPALECPMERVDLTFTLLPDLRLQMPRAHTPAGWITFGFHEDLDEAMVIALDGMLTLMQERYGFSRKEALAWADLVVDLRITQVVNFTRGVHALLPHDAILLP